MTHSLYCQYNNLIIEFSDSKVIPEAIRNMPAAPAWSLLFFCMIFLLGIDSQFTMIETVVTTLKDELDIHIPKILRRREVLVFCVIVITFLCSIPNLCPVIFFHLIGHMP